jgi:excisionase family DNA binding protein
MAKNKLIGTAQACLVLGVDKSTVSRLVRRGELPVEQKLPGASGALLFDPEAVARLAIDRGTKAAH